MIKKYVPDSYAIYVEILSEAAILGVQNSDDLEELIQQYKTNINSAPQWVSDFVNSDNLPDDEYEYVILYNNVVLEHIDDDDIVDVLKILSSQTMSN